MLCPCGAGQHNRGDCSTFLLQISSLESHVCELWSWMIYGHYISSLFWQPTVERCKKLGLDVDMRQMSQTRHETRTSVVHNCWANGATRVPWGLHVRQFFTTRNIWEENQITHTHFYSVMYFTFLKCTCRTVSSHFIKTLADLVSSLRTCFLFIWCTKWRSHSSWKIRCAKSNNCLIKQWICSPVSH